MSTWWSQRKYDNGLVCYQFFYSNNDSFAQTRYMSMKNSIELSNKLGDLFVRDAPLTDRLGVYAPYMTDEEYQKFMIATNNNQ